MLRTLRPLLTAVILTGTVACAQTPTNNTQQLFTDPPHQDGGWKGLANLLEALTPSIDTAIPLSASDITNRIATMLDQGQNQQALDIIEKREQQLENNVLPGKDVQLLFLRARALSGLERHNDAIAVYQDMTVLYPELPEPWNNLAAEYVKQGKLDMARDALTMALTADPHYATARTNLSDVLQMQARQLLQ